MPRLKFLLLLLFVLSCSAPAASPASAANLKAKIKKAPGETVIFVGDLHCQGCAKKVARKLYAVKGVVKVRTDLKADVAIVTPQKKKKIDPQALWSAVDAAGFPAVKLVGPSGTYLPHPETKAAQKQSNPAATVGKQG